QISLHRPDLGVEVGDLAVELVEAGRALVDQPEQPLLLLRGLRDLALEGLDLGIDGVLVGLGLGGHRPQATDTGHQTGQSDEQRGGHDHGPTDDATPHLGHASNISHNNNRIPPWNRTPGRGSDVEEAAYRQRRPHRPHQHPDDQEQDPGAGDVAAGDQELLEQLDVVPGLVDAALDQVVPDPHDAVGQGGPGQALDETLEHERYSDEP